MATTTFPQVIEEDTYQSLQANFTSNPQCIAGSLRVATLGGCSVREVGARLPSHYFNHIRHMWRRPTIALMSQNGKSVNFDCSELSGNYVKYITREVTGDHLREIIGLDGDVLLFDLTRDIHMGVMKISADRYISNPWNARGIVDGLSEDADFDDVKIREIFGYEGGGFFSWYENHESFMDLWKYYYKNFINIVRQKYPSIKLIKFYFTNRKLGETDALFSDGSREFSINRTLREMYEFSDSIGVESIDVDEKYFLSDEGDSVAWGGPISTHYIDETYALIVDKINATLMSGRAPHNRHLISQAFARANWEAERRKHIRSLEADHGALVAERDDLVTRQENLLAERDSIKAERDSLLTAQESLLAEQQALIAERDSLLSAQESLLAERESFLAQQNTATDADHGSPQSAAGAGPSWHWSAGELSVGDGERVGNKIALVGRSGLLSYGPYVELLAGHYLACVSVSDIAGEGRLHIGVTCAFGERKIAHHVAMMAQKGMIYFPFLVKENEKSDIEIVIYAESYDVIMIDFVEIHRRLVDVNSTPQRLTDFEITPMRKGVLERFWK